MNRTLRWILIAALALAVICLAAGAAFVVLRGAPTLLGMGPQMMNPRSVDPGIRPPFNQGPGGQGQMPFGRNPRGLIPFAPRSAFGGLFGLGLTLLRLGVPLLVLALIVLLVFLLLRRPAAAAAASSGPAAVVPPSAGMTPCPNCDRPVQTDWVACPHCGHRLRETL